MSQLGLGVVSDDLIFENKRQPLLDLLIGPQIPEGKLKHDVVQGSRVHVLEKGRIDRPILVGKVVILLVQ